MWWHTRRNHISSFSETDIVHLNRPGRWGGGQFSRLLVVEVCASAVVMVVMLDTPCSEIECKTTGYPLHSHVSPSLPLPCVTVCHQVSTELYLLRASPRSETEVRSLCSATRLRSASCVAGKLTTLQGRDKCRQPLSWYGSCPVFGA